MSLRWQRCLWNTLNPPHAYFYGKWRRKGPTVFGNSTFASQRLRTVEATQLENGRAHGMLLSCLSRTRGECAAEIAQFVLHVGRICNCLRDFIAQQEAVALP